MTCRKKLLLISALAMTGCGLHQGQGRVNSSAPNLVGIVNGKDVKNPDTYSQHVVFLQIIMGEGVGYCTGSILDSETILTAAHCVVSGNAGVVIFANNVQNLSSKDAPQVRSIDMVAVYPQFLAPKESDDGEDGDGSASAPPGPDQTPMVKDVQQSLDMAGDVDYDLAVLHFTGGLPAGYTPVQLAQDASIVKTGSSLHMIGYGLAKVNPVKQLVGKEVVTVPTPDRSTVGQLRETAVPIATYDTEIGMIFTSGRTSSVCSGDSGGPAFMQDPKTGAAVQVGIADAVATPYCNSVSMHTAVFPYLAWIKQKQKDLAAGAAAAAASEN